MKSIELEHYPLGYSFAAGSHGVSCSLPTMADVIGYEEGEAAVLAAMENGYPRFKRHALIARLIAFWAKEQAWPVDQVFVCPSRQSADSVGKFAGGDYQLHERSGVWALVLHSPEEKVLARAKAFLQHTGCAISSRQAEDVLRGWMPDLLVEEELLFAGTDEQAADAVMGQVAEYIAGRPEQLLLAQGGMNAFYAVFQALQQRHQSSGRRVWLQLGWLYIDTMRILEQFLPEEGELITVWDVTDWAAIEELLLQRGTEIVGVVTEVPTNPLLETIDVERLYALCRQQGACLIVDPSLSGIATVNPLPFADVVVCSLTKYFGHQCDVLAGVLAVPYTQEGLDLLAEASSWMEPMYGRDVRRLASGLAVLPTLMEKIHANTAVVVDFLEQHKKVARVWHAYGDDDGEWYRRLAGEARPGAVLSFEVLGDATAFYDALAMPKGPSFGAYFSLLSPYLYLAHYHEIQAGTFALPVSPLLMRLSVGMEDVDKIVAVLDDALAQA